VILGNRCEFRWQHLVSEAVVVLKAHDQRTPTIRIDTVRVAAKTDSLMHMHALHVHGKQMHIGNVICDERRFHRYGRFLYAWRPHGV